MSPVSLQWQRVTYTQRIALVCFHSVWFFGSVWFGWVLLGWVSPPSCTPVYPLSLRFRICIRSSPFSTFDWHTEVEDGNRIGIETADSTAPTPTTFSDPRLHRPLSVLISRLGPIIMINTF